MLARKCGGRSVSPLAGICHLHEALAGHFASRLAFVSDLSRRRVEAALPWRGAGAEIV